MKKFSKNLFFLSLFLVAVFLSTSVYADPAPHSSELAQKICDIRNIFCGGGGLAVIMFSIGMIGLMVFNGRMHWSILLMVAAGFAIFLGADVFVNNLSGDDSVSECECL